MNDIDVKRIQFLLEEIWRELVQQTTASAPNSFQETVFTDDNGVVFIRKTIYDPITDSYSIVYETINGTPYVPVNPTPLIDYSVQSLDYIAIANGTGYTIGDLIQQWNIIDPIANTIKSTLYFNQNTNNLITPLFSDLGTAPSSTVSLTNIENNVLSKKNRIKGAADYNMVIIYVGATTDVATITHTGTTALGLETITETYTYDGSNRLTNVTYS